MENWALFDSFQTLHYWQKPDAACTGALKNSQKQPNFPKMCQMHQLWYPIRKLFFGYEFIFYASSTVFPHIVATATILCWNLRCGNYSREETIDFFLLIICTWFKLLLHPNNVEMEKFNKNSIDIVSFRKIRFFCRLKLMQLGNLNHKRASFFSLSLLL